MGLSCFYPMRGWLTLRGMKIARWLLSVIGAVSATWACGTMAAPQGKGVPRVLRRVTSEKLVPLLCRDLIITTCFVPDHLRSSLLTLHHIGALPWRVS